MIGMAGSRRRDGAVGRRDVEDFEDGAVDGRDVQDVEDGAVGGGDIQDFVGRVIMGHEN